MALGMSALGDGAALAIGELRAEDEEGGLDARGVEDVEHAGRDRGFGAVIEGERDLHCSGTLNPAAAACHLCLALVRYMALAP